MKKRTSNAVEIMQRHFGSDAEYQSLLEQERTDSKIRKACAELLEHLCGESLKEAYDDLCVAVAGEADRKAILVPDPVV